MSSRRPRFACNAFNDKRIRNEIIASPKKPVVKHTTVLVLIERSTRIMLKKTNFHPYKMTIVQEINDQSKINGLEFCCLIHDNHQGNENNVFMSDEAHFYLNDDVNKQNCCYWAQENLHKIHQRPLHCPKITVWCAISSSRIVRAFFFFLRKWSDSNSELLLRATFKCCRYFYHKNKTKLDILWGYLKHRVYANKPRNLRKLKTNIINDISGFFKIYKIRPPVRRKY